MTYLVHVEDPNEACGPGCPIWEKQMQEQNDAQWEPKTEGNSVQYNPAAAAPKPQAKTKQSIAHEAYGLVHGDRAKTYGHPRFDFTAIAKVWTGLLSDKLKPGEELDAYRVAVLMTGLKLCRLVKSPGHHDSRVDTIGYMLTMERLDEPEEEEKTEDTGCCTPNPLTGKPMSPGSVVAGVKYAEGGPIDGPVNSQDDSVPAPIRYAHPAPGKGFKFTGEEVRVQPSIPKWACGHMEDVHGYDAVAECLKSKARRATRESLHERRDEEKHQ